MGFKVTGKITKVKEVQSGTSAAGKEWKKVEFLLETNEEYDKLYCFEVFGEEKVDNFIKFNKVGSTVDVEFNVKTNEWKDKHFVSLGAWKVFKAEGANNSASNDEDTDLPF